MTDIPKMAKTQRAAFLAIRPDGEWEIHMDGMATRLHVLTTRYPDLVEEGVKNGWKRWRLTPDAVFLRAGLRP